MRSQTEVRATSEIVVVLVIIQVFFFNNVQFDWIQTHYFQGCSAFVTRNRFALIRVHIHVDIGIAFRASSCRHFFYLQRKL